MVKTATIYGINGPVIYLKGNTGFRMSEMVYVGDQKLVGEVISLDKDLTTVQVFNEDLGARLALQILYRIKHPHKPHEITYLSTNVLYRGSTGD